MNVTNRTKKQWQEILDEQTFKVTREQGTERPFTGLYWDTFEEGVYRCKCCNNALFGSETKFDAGCGWPSFYGAIESKAVVEKIDNSHGMQRIEVRCANCDAHLGHRFEDGPVPTGQRFCINSVAITFEDKGDGR